MNAFDDEQLANKRNSQERFSLIFCNAAILIVLFLPGQDFPLSARIGFLVGLGFLDVLMIAAHVKFRGNTAAMKKNRTYRTLYYFSWGMVGLAILLLLLNTLGFFRSGPEYSLYTVTWNPEAVSGVWQEELKEDDVAQVTQVKTLSSVEDLKEILDTLGETGENRDQILGDLTDSVFETHAIGCISMSTGHTLGQIGANSKTGSDGKLQITVYFKPSDQKSEDVNAYLLFAKMPPDGEEALSSSHVQLQFS